MSLSTSSQSCSTTSAMLRYEPADKDTARIMKLLSGESVQSRTQPAHGL